jgi:NAD+ kinase
MTRRQPGLIVAEPVSAPDGLAIVEDEDMQEPSCQSSGSGRRAPSREVALRQVGLVVHPTRALETALGELRAWASAHELMVGQVPVSGQTRQVADPVAAAACDLLLGIGGDGTALSALHAAAPTSRPVLGIACGSIGVLTSVSVERIAWALDEIATGRWTPVAIPGLDVTWGEAQTAVAINDVALIRDGSGQIMVSIALDDVLYAELAGDGVVVATALGSGAYTMAAGGPLLAPGAEGMAVTPLSTHGGSCPPLVAGPGSHVTLRVQPGHAGVRCELDGRRSPVEGNLLTIRHRRHYATLVTLDGEEPRLTGLRRRGLVRDSPRVVVRGSRWGAEADRPRGAWAS